MAQDKPNILFIMVDQLAAPFLAAYGHKVVKTPNIDKLAAQRRGLRQLLLPLATLRTCARCHDVRPTAIPQPGL
jgi:hypothetical protein